MNDLTAAQRDGVRLVAAGRVGFEPAVNVWLLDDTDAGPDLTSALDGLCGLGVVRRPQSYQPAGQVSFTALGEQLASQVVS